MSQRSLTPSPTPSPSPGPLGSVSSRSPTPTPYYYGKVFRIASDVNIGEFVDGNLWKYRKKGSGSLSPLFDEFGFDEKPIMTDAGVQVDLLSRPTESPILTKAIIYELEPADKNNNSRETSTSMLNGAANGSMTVNGIYPGIPGSPTYASASFMANVHRLHCAMCKTPEKCSQNPTMRLACPIQQCSDPKCEIQFHVCMQEQHGTGCSARSSRKDQVDSSSPQPQKPASLALASWRDAHYQAYAAKHGPRLPWPVFTVSRDAEPGNEGGNRVYGGTFFSNRFRASREIYLCEIGFHGPAEVPQAKYTVYVEIFEPQAPEPEKAMLTKKSKSKSKYRLQLPLPSIPVHIYPKGLLRERICRRRWTNIETKQGELFYVDLLEDDVVRGMPPVRIQAGVWYLIQFCIEGSAATTNCSRTLEQVRLTLVGSGPSPSSSSNRSESEGSIQFSFNVGSMQMPELRFAVAPTAPSQGQATQAQTTAQSKSALKPEPGSSANYSSTFT